MREQKVKFLLRSLNSYLQNVLLKKITMFLNGSNFVLRVSLSISLYLSVSLCLSVSLSVSLSLSLNIRMWNI